MVAEIKNHSLEQAIAEINREIDSRTTYRVRVEELPTRAKVWGLQWINGSAEWWPYYPDRQVKCKCEAGTSLDRALNIVNEPWCVRREKRERGIGGSDEQVEAAWSEIREKTHGFGMHLRPPKGETAPCVCTEVVHPKQCLDANQIIVTGLTKAILQEMVPVLHQLPLYRGSFEARGQGEFSLKGIEIPPGLKKAWIESELGGKPLDIQSQIALEEKAQEN